MPEIREGLVEVIGASIHYQVSGHGPTLLLLSPGDGNADAFSGIAPLLDGFTVVTCDRRGQARSAIVDPAEPVTIATHADDMARVLVAVTTHGARVFGAGLGAVIGLELVARHPHRVSTLVAFEPSLPTLLDVDADVDQADADAIGDYVIDSVALRASHVAILPAAGRASRGSWTHGAAGCAHRCGVGFGRRGMVRGAHARIVRAVLPAAHRARRRAVVRGRQPIPSGGGTPCSVSASWAAKVAGRVM